MGGNRNNASNTNLKEIIEIIPKSKINGAITIPGSKSYTNRALFCASLAEGISILENAGFCDDTASMTHNLAKLGVVVESTDRFNLIHRITVKGNHPERLHPAGEELNIGAAGTTMRFLTGLCSLIEGSHKIIGTERMHERPIEDLTNSLNQIIDGSITAESLNKDNKRCPPVEIKTRGLKGGIVEIRVDSCSQYLSSLLMAAPYAHDNLKIIPVGNFIEKPYIEMTIETMQSFGVEVKKENDNYIVEVGQKYKPGRYFIESDASNASYFMAAAAITGGSICVGKFNRYSTQGDIAFAETLEKMGCYVKGNGQGNNKWSHVLITSSNKLKGVDVDYSNTPDLVPTLAFLSAVAEGETTIRNIGNLRIKETDRISALEKELAKTGIKTSSGEDYLTIYGGNPAGAELDSHGDHRMVMGAAILGLRIPGISIRNYQDVTKSFPKFFEYLDKL